MTTGTRGGNGRYIRTANSMKRDTEAASLRARGLSFQRIADELGFASKGKAHDAVTRAFRDIPYEGTEDARRLDLERIDRLIEQAWAVMEREHVTVSQGRVVGKMIGVERDENGSPVLDADGGAIPVYEDILDDGPVLAAIREIRGLLERRAKITGYDAPAKSRIEVVTSDMIEDEIMRLEAELGKHDQADRSTA